MIKLKQALHSKISDFKSFLKKLTFPAAMRLFTQKKKEYDALISRVDSLIDTLEVTAADSDGTSPVTRKTTTRALVTRKTTTRAPAPTTPHLQDEEDEEDEPTPTTPHLQDEPTPPDEAPPKFSGVTTIDISDTEDDEPPPPKFGDTTTIGITGTPRTGTTVKTKLDVVKTLVGNTAIPLEEFVVPDRKKLAQQVSELAQIEQSLVECDGFFAFAYGLNTVAGKSMKTESVKYRAVLEAKAEALTTILQELSFKHEPKIMKNIREAAYNYIIDKLPPGTYGQPSNDLYVSSHDALVGDSGASIQFTCFIYLPMLDMDVFKSGDLTIILTGVVSLSPIKKNYSMELHVTSLNTVNPRELQPGKFDPGEKMSGADTAALISSMKKEIDALLSLNRLKPELASMRLGPYVTQQALRESAILSITNVVDTDVSGGKEIIIRLKPGTSEKQANNVYFKVVPILHRIPGLAIRRKAGSSTRFTYTVNIDSEGNRYLAITKVKELSGRD
jgi:hypothetical protein